MKKKILSILFFSTLFIICLNTKVNASYHATDRTVNSEESVSITITSTSGLENFDIECTNTGGLTYKSCSSITGAVVNSSGKTISYAMIGGNAKTLGTYKFTAPKVTEQKIYNVVFDVNGSTVTSKVIVKPKSDNNNNNTATTTKSTNANLSTLGVTPKEYDFTGFSKNKTEYNVTVPNDVDSLKVAYKTEDAKATVKVTGNTNLEVGTNTIKVVVTAEDGKTTKAYTIKVTKLATEDEKPGNVIDDEKTSLYLKSLEIEGLTLSPEFSSEVYSYETTINMDEKDLSEIKINAKANSEDAVIEITGNTNLVEGENLVNIIVKSSDSTEQKVYQITVNKVSGASEIVNTNDNSGKISIKKEYLIIGSFIIIVIIMLTILIISHIKNKRYYLEEDELSEKESDNENTDTTNSNNVVEELFNKKKNGKGLKKEEQEILEEIENENDRIFNKPKQGETVEYEQNNEEIEEDPFIKELKERGKKGKHF